MRLTRVGRLLDPVSASRAGPVPPPTARTVAGRDPGPQCAGKLQGMSRISTDEVARVAGLAHIALTEAEIEKIAGELDVIATSVAKVSEVATPDVPATSHPIHLTNVWREDIVGQTLDRDEVLASAPAAEDGMFLVPQMLDDEEA